MISKFFFVMMMKIMKKNYWNLKPIKKKLLPYKWTNQKRKKKQKPKIKIWHKFKCEEKKTKTMNFSRCKFFFQHEKKLEFKIQDLIQSISFRRKSKKKNPWLHLWCLVLCEIEMFLNKNKNEMWAWLLSLSFSLSLLLLLLLNWLFERKKKKWSNPHVWFCEPSKKMGLACTFHSGLICICVCFFFFFWCNQYFTRKKRMKKTDFFLLHFSLPIYINGGLDLIHATWKKNRVSFCCCYCCCFWIIVFFLFAPCCCCCCCFFLSVSSSMSLNGWMTNLTRQTKEIKIKFFFLSLWC